MPAPVFSPPLLPTAPAKVVVEPRVLKAEFGDGYSQRIGAGINTMSRQWELTWGPTSTGSIDAIAAFFEARGGVEAFRWTPPRETVERLFICERWEVIERGIGLAELTATFREVFDLGA